MSNELVELTPSNQVEAGPDARRRSWILRLAIALAGLLLLAAVVGALALAPLEKAWRHARARQLFRQYRDEDALAELRLALRRDLGDAKTLLLLARAHRRLGNLDRVPLLLDRAQVLSGDPLIVERERRLVLAQTGRLREVEAYLPEMLVNAGDDGPDVCQAFVQGYFANLRGGDALQLLDAWEKSDPDDPQPVFMRAYLVQSMTDPEQAIPLYRQGLSQAPYRTLMRRRLAEALLNAHELDQAEAELAVCLEQSPKDPRVHYVMAECAYQRSQLDVAAQRVAEALRYAPEDLDARRLKGQLDLSQGKFEEALRELQPVVAREPYDMFAREALGRTLQGLGRTEEAKPHFEYVARAEPNMRRLDRLSRESLQAPKDANLRYEIGTLLFEFGPPEDAARWMQAALELDPKHAGAHRALAAHFEARGDGAKALLHRQLAGGVSEK